MRPGDLCRRQLLRVVQREQQTLVRVAVIRIEFDRFAQRSDGALCIGPAQMRNTQIRINPAVRRLYPERFRVVLQRSIELA